MLDSIKRGFNKAWITFLGLVKIIIPTYVGVTFLKYTGIIDIVADFFSPVMEIIGLPGEAMLALITSYLLNIYAGIGVILSIDLGIREITIMGVMIGIAHSLILESAIFKKLNIGLIKINLIRVSLSLPSGFILNLIL
ncbi:MAG: nucleoside recognition domain-containing protein [Bacillota bacterium]